MMKILLRTWLLAAAIAMAVMPHASIHAQTYPSKPVKLMVGFAPGGIADIVTRLIGQTLTQHLGQPVIVENKPGADSRIALQQLATAPADGYLINLSDA